MQQTEDDRRRFQSTLPRRERPKISVLTVWTEGFNPRSREGSDPGQVLTIPGGSGFQSTLPRRERRNDLSYGNLGYWFQSTLPRRERRNMQQTEDDRRRFQSTLPRRERRAVPSGRAGSYCVSIHAPAKGVKCYNKVVTKEANKIY